MTTNIILRDTGKSEIAGKVGWRSPSNLAIVKYWGKYGFQLPKNPSLSLTLSEAFTETTIDYSSHKGNEMMISFSFEGKEMPAFAKRIKRFLSSLDEVYPYLSQMRLDIKSSNSFPHSSGIASSASSMSALALCLCSMEMEHLGTLQKSGFLEKASYISRIGSGSACRSVYGPAAIWGEHKKIRGSSPFHAIPFGGSKMHDVFKTFHDDILIISADKKSVSSSVGHALMKKNIYAKSRYKQARKRIIALIESMKGGDIETFGRIAEDEALTLHALMMCSNPSYMLMEPESMAAIKSIRRFRQETKLPLYFSLDAGPNIHLLYPHNSRKEISKFIQEELKKYCDNGRIINDHVGKGPVAL